MKLFHNKLKKVLAGLCLLGFLGITGAAFGADGTIGTVAASVRSTFTDIGTALIGVAYVAGFGCAVVAILKFKSNRENPQQTPLGTPIMFLAVAVVLVFLPTILVTSGNTFFEGDQVGGGFEGGGHTAISS